MSDGRRSPSARAAMRGFTLIEMLVVMAILALIVTIVPPLIRRGEARNVHALAHAVAADLRLLRDQAIRQDADTAFVLRNGVYVLKPSGRTRSLPRDIAVTVEAAPRLLLPQPGGVIAFFPDGSSTGGVVTLALRGTAARILVRPADGRVRFDE